VSPRALHAPPLRGVRGAPTISPTPGPSGRIRRVWPR
jgi:hypothetical protein